MEQHEVADLLEIQQLAARYMMFSSRKEQERWLEVFTPDGEYNAFGTPYGMDDFPALLKSAPPGQYVGNPPIVELDGDTATAVQHFVFVDQVTHEMRRDADARLDGHAVAAARTIDQVLSAAESDIRLGRRNEVFEAALADTSGQLLPADRAKVEAAITYLGDRYHVDEICVIRATGLEAARWVGGQGVAAVADLSPDDAVQIALLNNPGLQASYAALGIAEADLDLARAHRLRPEVAGDR